MIRLFVYAVVLMSVISCGPKFKEGRVLQKNFYPAHYRDYTTYIYVGKVLIPQRHHNWVEDRYELVIYKISKGDTFTEDFNVSQSDFYNSEINQQISFK